MADNMEGLREEMTRVMVEHEAAQRRERYAAAISAECNEHAAAEATMDLADEEQEELREENARLKAELEQWQVAFQAAMSKTRK